MVLARPVAGGGNVNPPHPKLKKCRYEYMLYSYHFSGLGQQKYTTSFVKVVFQEDQV